MATRIEINDYFLDERLVQTINLKKGGAISGYDNPILPKGVMVSEDCIRNTTYVTAMDGSMIYDGSSDEEVQTINPEEAKTEKPIFYTEIRNGEMATVGGSIEGHKYVMITVRHVAR